MKIIDANNSITIPVHMDGRVYKTVPKHIQKDLLDYIKKRNEDLIDNDGDIVFLLETEKDLIDKALQHIQEYRKSAWEKMKRQMEVLKKIQTEKLSHNERQSLQSELNDGLTDEQFGGLQRAQQSINLLGFERHYKLMCMGVSMKKLWDEKIIEFKNGHHLDLNNFLDSHTTRQIRKMVDQVISKEKRN